MPAVSFSKLAVGFDFYAYRNSLKQYRTVIVVQLRRRILPQTMSIEEARATPLPAKLVVKYDGIEASKCAKRH